MKHAWNVLFAMIALSGSSVLMGQNGKANWQDRFPVDRKTLGTKGHNPYFPLTPGYQWSYRHGNETEVVTVLSETKMIDGV